MGGIHLCAEWGNFFLVLLFGPGGLGAPSEFLNNLCLAVSLVVVFVSEPKAVSEWKLWNLNYRLTLLGDSVSPWNNLFGDGFLSEDSDVHTLPN